MRVGQNPAKFIDHVPQPARITVAIVTYIPFLNGYYAESLAVLKACLGSLWDNTSLPYDLMVFDNASCPEVREYLLDMQHQAKIQYLLLSDKNVGKGGAWNFIFQGAPGELIAYADSDIYFLTGWLENSLEILETFPKVGMVTARPLRTPEQFNTSTLEWAQQDPKARVERGQFQSWETFKEHTDSLGLEEQKSLERFQSMDDWKITYMGVAAYTGAAHFQFIGCKDVLQPIFPLAMDRPMGQVRSLDQKLNELGYLRLTTCSTFVKHLGNRLESQPEKIPQTRKPSPSLQKRLLNWQVMRRFLLGIYNQIFRWYFEGK